MKITRRSAALGGMSLLASTAMSKAALAEQGHFSASAKVSRSSGSRPTPTSSAIRW